MAWLDKYSNKTPKAQFGETMFKSPSMVDYEQPSDELINDDYDMARALELGYTPDKTGHWNSVDYETGEWLKSKKHHTRGMELMAYELNPELHNAYNLIENEKGKMQYIPKGKNGIEGTMGGLTDKGFNYNGAWGGQFQGGGNIPGSVGFTYARTQGIPSEGKYAKKTLPSAQNGFDMYGNPIIANIKRDNSVTRTNYNPRTNTIIFGSDQPLVLSPEILEKTLAHENRHAWQFANDRTNFDMVHNPEYAFQERLKKKPEFPSTDEVFENYHNRKAIESQLDVERVKANNPSLALVPNDIIYNKIVDNDQYSNPNSLEGEAEYYQNTGRSFQNGGEMSYYQHGLDFTPKGMQNGGWLSKYEEGGVIKDDRGQWAHPGEITEIGSNQITMQGVPYPVLGISDTGDVKMMYPGEDYEFDGESVTEFPMARNGINNLDAKPLQKLNQLTNFTNYNSSSDRGWLSKYE